MKIKTLITTLFFLLITTSIFAANDVWIAAKPQAEIKDVGLDCNTFTLPTMRIYLTKNPVPSGKLYFYSVIYHYDLLGTNPLYYIARTDILNRYVFIRWDNDDSIRSQMYSSGFIPLFSAWEDTSFYYVLKNRTCTQLKQYHFVYGFSSKPDLSDFEGASFYFK
jgi:hypothetical protein